MPITVKQSLEEIRTDLQMTGAELARQAQVSASTITRIEHKQSNVSLLVVKRILKVLNARQKMVNPEAPEITREDIDWDIM